MKECKRLIFLRGFKIIIFRYFYKFSSWYISFIFRFLYIVYRMLSDIIMCLKYKEKIKSYNLHFHISFSFSSRSPYNYTPPFIIIWRRTWCCMSNIWLKTTSPTFVVGRSRIFDGFSKRNCFWRREFDNESTCLPSNKWRTWKTSYM